MDKPVVNSKRLPRPDLWSFLKNHRLVKAFEDAQTDIIDTMPNAIQATGEDASNILAGSTFKPRLPPPPIDGASAVLAIYAHAPRVQTPQLDQAGVILMGQVFGA